MPFATVFTCENVEFSATPRSGHDQWHSVKISVQEMGLTNRWIYVELNGNPRPVLPAVHIALSEGWDLSCNERAMTLQLHGQEVQSLGMVTKKLRFNKVVDFWSFLYEVALSRVREYTARERRVRPYVGGVSTEC